MEEHYGSKEKAEQVLYASKNAGKISGIDAYDDADVERAARSMKIDALCDAVAKLSTRIDAYCSRMDDHRVIGGVSLRSSPKGAADPNIAQ